MINIGPYPFSSSSIGPYPIYPSGSGDLIAGNPPNYSYWNISGSYRGFGAAQTWRDEKTDSLSLQSSNANGHIAINATEGVQDFGTSSATGDYLYCNIQLNHDRISSGIISPHVHFFSSAQNNAGGSLGMPNWLFSYRWQVLSPTASKQSAWTSIPISGAVFNNTAGTTIQQIAESVDLVPPSNSDISDIIQCRIARDVNNASNAFTGVDSYLGTISLLSFDIHVQCNTLGSWQEYSKY